MDCKVLRKATTPEDVKRAQEALGRVERDLIITRSEARKLLTRHGDSFAADPELWDHLNIHAGVQPPSREAHWSAIALEEGVQKIFEIFVSKHEVPLVKLKRDYYAFEIHQDADLCSLNRGYYDTKRKPIDAPPFDHATMPFIRAKAEIIDSRWVELVHDIFETSQGVFVREHSIDGERLWYKFEIPPFDIAKQ